MNRCRVYQYGNYSLYIFCKYLEKCMYLMGMDNLTYYSMYYIYNFIYYNGKA